jgi:DNA-binding response OmpR family regulator
MKILVIDDEKSMRIIAQYNLSKAGHDVLIAETAGDGLRLADAEGPDVILLDMMLPDLDGMQVLQALAASEVTGGIPVVMFSAKGQNEDVQNALAAGAVGYITKPFDPTRLSENILECLSNER